MSDGYDPRGALRRLAEVYGAPRNPPRNHCHDKPEPAPRVMRLPQNMPAPKPAPDVKANIRAYREGARRRGLLPPIQDALET